MQQVNYTQVGCSVSVAADVGVTPLAPTYAVAGALVSQLKTAVLLKAQCPTYLKIVSNEVQSKVIFSYPYGIY